MKDKQKGFTLNELIIVIFILIALSCFGGALYVVGHFIAKFW